MDNTCKVNLPHLMGALNGHLCGALSATILLRDRDAFDVNRRAFGAP